MQPRERRLMCDDLLHGVGLCGEHVERNDGTAAVAEDVS
jgi:hypothetical protein